jgi:hypothetical protein
LPHKGHIEENSMGFRTLSKIFKPSQPNRLRFKPKRKNILLFPLAFLALFILLVSPAHAVLTIDGTASFGSTTDVSSSTVALTTTNPNDIIYVFVTLRDNGPTVSSVTAPGLTFALRGSVDNAGNVFSYAYYAVASSTLSSTQITVTLTGGTTRITITAFGVSGANTSCPFDPNTSGFSSATGNSVTPSVMISTSTANDVILGLVGTWIPSGNSPPSFTPGGGFSLIINPYVASTSGFSNVEGGSEYNVVSSTQTNLAVSATLGTSSQWAMLADSIEMAGATCQSIKITTANGAPSGTGTVSGCAVSPTTIAFDGNQHFFTATGSCALTVTVPADGANARYRFSGGTTYSLTTCASGVCAPASTTIYYQLQNTYSVVTAGQGPPSWDAGLTFTFTGTLLGTAGQTICSDNPTSGTITMASCTAWADYNQAVAAPTNPTGQGTNIQWQVSGTSSFSDTTGGNSHNVNYYKQLQNTYQDTPNAQTTWDSSLNGGQPVGASLGVPGTSICTVTLTGGGGSASCTGWADYNTAVSIGTISNAPANSRWLQSGVSSWTDTSGGNTHTSNFFKQWTNTFQISATAPPTFDSGLTLTITGTVAGTAGSPICTITTTSAPTAYCSGYSDINTSATFASNLTGTPSNTRWQNGAGGPTNTATITSGGNTFNASYYKQLSNTYTANPSAPTTFDGNITFTVTGTFLGAASSTICAVSVPSSPGPSSYSCAGYADYKTAVGMPTASGNNPSNIRWEISGTSSFTDTTGGNTHITSYYKQLSNTYQITPNAQTAWDSGLSFTLTGTLLGSGGSTICIISPAGGSGIQSCIAWADYSTAVSFPTNPSGQGPNIRWQPVGTQSFTQTTGGNTNNINYYKQLSNTYQVTASGQSTFDPGLWTLVNRTYLGTSSTVILIAPSGGAATGSASGWTDYNTIAVFPASMGGAFANARWENAANGPSNTLPVTTGGNTFNTTYYKQWNNTFQITAKAQSAFDPNLTLSITGAYLGTASSTICTISTPAATMASCSGYSDQGSTVTFKDTLTGAPVNSRWENSANGTSNTGTITSGGSSINTNYYKQWTNTFQVTPTGPTTFDSARNFTITGTYLGTPGATICIISPTNGKGISSCSGYCDNNAVATFPATSTGGSTSTKWTNNNNGAQNTPPITSGGNTLNANYSLLGLDISSSFVFFLILPILAACIGVFILAFWVRRKKTKQTPKAMPRPDQTDSVPGPNPSDPYNPVG